MQSLKAKNALLLGSLVSVNVGVWILLLLFSHRYPFLFPLGTLAYIFGLRHAVDADHIAAIDNTTRKLMNDGKKPLGVGLFFSLGHTTVVFCLAAGLAVATHIFKSVLHNADAEASLIATVASAGFLYLIATLNLVILRDIYRIFRKVRRTRLTPEKQQELEELLLKRGLMNRVLGKAYHAINAAWQMYPVGFLFGLGFDTASEMALFAMAVLAAGKGLPIWVVLILPLVFSAGMVLVDTLDGVVMLSAYSWAFLHPVRKLYYNLSITTVSVLIALGVGSVEWLQVMGSQLSLKGVFWDWVQGLDFGVLGYGIIAILLVSWAVAFAVYKLKGYEKEAPCDSAG